MMTNGFRPRYGSGIRSRTTSAGGYRGAGRWIPQQFKVAYDDPERPFLITFEIMATADGVPTILRYFAERRFIHHVMEADSRNFARGPAGTSKPTINPSPTTPLVWGT